MKSAGAIVVFFGLFWLTLVGAFDYFVFSRMIQQLAAEKYPTAAGTVLHSEVTSRSGSKGGTSYGIKIKYRYEVAGKPYESNRYRYDEDNSSDSRHARAVIKSHPPGAKVTVFYNPRNPADAVLSTGIAGSSLFFLLFLTPFNLIGLMFLWIPLAGFLARSKNPDTGGVRVWKEGSRWRARLSNISALAAAAATLGFGAFISIFVVGFSMGFHPSMRTMNMVWAILLGLAFSAFLYRKGRINSGREDMILEETTGMISLPQTHGRKQPEAISLKEIEAIHQETKIHRNSKGRTSYSYAVGFKRPSGEVVKLTEFSSEPEAQKFTKWLGSKLGRPVGGLPQV